MKLSFEDEESFKEAVESLRFNNPRSDLDTLQQMGSSGSMPLEDQWNEDNVILSDPITLRRVGSSSSLSIQETRTRRSGPGDIQDFTCTSANGM